MQVAGGVTPEAWDDIFPNAKAARDEQKLKGLVFAQNYLVFSGPTSDPRARALLELWTQVVRKRTVPASAGLGEHAAANAFREFIEGIHSQIEFATNGANEPPTTPRK